MSRSTDGGERLSSRLTFFLKFVFPAVWIAAFGIAALAAAGASAGRSLPLLVVPFAFAAVVFTWLAGRLKKVTATDRGLVVSNYRRELLVPYEQIASVRESRYHGARPITVELRSTTPLGKRLVLVPYASLVVGGDHPAAILLRERAEAARRSRAGDAPRPTA